MPKFLWELHPSPSKFSSTPVRLNQLFVHQPPYSKIKVNNNLSKNQKYSFYSQDYLFVVLPVYNSTKSSTFKRNSAPASVTSAYCSYLDYSFPGQLLFGKGFLSTDSMTIGGKTIQQQTFIEMTSLGSQMISSSYVIFNFCQTSNLIDRRNQSRQTIRFKWRLWQLNGTIFFIYCS